MVDTVKVTSVPFNLLEQRKASIRPQVVGLAAVAWEDSAVVMLEVAGVQVIKPRVLRASMEELLRGLHMEHPICVSRSFWEVVVAAVAKLRITTTMPQEAMEELEVESLLSRRRHLILIVEVPLTLLVTEAEMSVIREMKAQVEEEVQVVAS